jgi:hypothetical protein
MIGRTSGEVVSRPQRSVVEHIEQLSVILLLVVTRIRLVRMLCVEWPELKVESNERLVGARSPEKVTLVTLSSCSHGKHCWTSGSSCSIREEPQNWESYNHFSVVSPVVYRRTCDRGVALQ